MNDAQEGGDMTTRDELAAHDKRALGIIRLATEQAEEIRALRLAFRQEVGVTVEDLTKSLLDEYSKPQAWSAVASALLAKYSITNRTEGEI